MYITTGDLTDSQNIEKNLGIISANVIAGTGVFSDIAASFSDFFGGSSESYKKQFEWITKSALEDLKSKSRILGGNAIMGLRIDTNELSGKNKQMLMITVYGSAIKIKNNDNQEKSQNDYFKKEEISVDEFLSLRREKDRIANLKNEPINKIFSRNDLAECTSAESIDIILDKIFKIGEGIEEIRNSIGYMNGWLRIIDAKSIIDFISRYVASEEKISIYLLNNFNSIFDGVTIFDFHLIETLLKKLDRSSRRLGLSLTTSTKITYSRSDIVLYENVIELINNMQPAEEYEKKSLTSTKIMWKCVGGHEMNANDKLCRVCTLNKLGLENGEPERFINEINLRIEHLNELLA
jgi:uncharacterized protein YbjQ (UPF0145 family)